MNTITNSPNHPDQMDLASVGNDESGYQGDYQTSRPPYSSAELLAGITFGTGVFLAVLCFSTAWYIATR